MKPLLYWMDFSKIKKEDVVFQKNNSVCTLPFSEFVSNFVRDESVYCFISNEITLGGETISYLQSDLACFINVLAYRRVTKCKEFASLLPFKSKYDGDLCALILSEHGIVNDAVIFVPSGMKALWTENEDIGVARYWYYEFYKNEKRGRMHAMTPKSEVHYFDKKKLFPELCWDEEDEGN